MRTLENFIGKSFGVLGKVLGFLRKTLDDPKKYFGTLGKVFGFLSKALHDPWTSLGALCKVLGFLCNALGILGNSFVKPLMLTLAHTLIN